MDFLNLNHQFSSIVNSLEPPRNYHLADYQHEILIEVIRDFESKLDNDHEIALKLASFGQSITMNVVDIGYSNPCLIHFYGYVNGQYTELIQHINQLNFLIMAVKKQDPSKEPRRIGFINTDSTSKVAVDNE